MKEASKVVYRAPVVEDAAEMVSFYNRVGGETTYLSFEENEYPMDEKAQRANITDCNDQPNATILLATVEGKIVGIGTIHSATKIKARHCGELGIVVEQKYQGQGIGTEIIKRLLEWCRNNGITTKVELTTRTDNKNAVELYKRFGFEIEGELKNSTLIDGTYYHVYVMGLMF